MIQEQKYDTRRTTTLSRTMEQHHFDDHAENHPTRMLVAVPDPDAGRVGSSELYRLGVQSNEAGATFTIGEHGPAGQRLPWIYMRSGETIRYEIDLDKGTLTIAITNPESGQSGVVVHQIDTELMNDQEIVVGQPVRIVFAYDKRMVDETTEIDEWCATTGPRHTEELHARLKQINHIVEEIEAAEHEAQAHEHYVLADHAPKTAEPLVRPTLDENGDPGLPGVGEDVDTELDYALPEGVQIFDPISGKTFVGRRWARPHEQTTLQALVNGGYRLAVVEFKNGDTATLMPNFSGSKMGIQIKTHKGMVSRVLDESANFTPLGPGHRIDAEMSHTFDGDHAVEGKMLTTPPIVVVVGVGPEAERSDLPYPHDHTLEKFRQERKPVERNFGPEVGRRLAKAI